MKKTVKGFFAILITAVSACAISFLLYRYIVEGGIYPSGEDVYYHLFRGDLLFKAIHKGDAYPLYSSLWYNGIQPLRYTPPLSAFLFALCELYTGGQIYIAYVIYCCAIFVTGQIVWTIAGFRVGRPVLGAIIGILWFFSPVNMQVLFSQGNLALALCNCIVPLLFVAVCEYLGSGKVAELFGIICVSCVMILSHTGMTLLYFLLILMFMLVQRFFFKNRRRILKVVVAFVISFLCCGLYTLPSLYNGFDFKSADKAGNYFQNILKTIDPLAVLRSRDAIYFGLPLLVIAILGVVVSNKKSSPIFLSAIFALFMTSGTACIMISIIPGAEMLWLIRLLPGAAAFVYLGMIYWEKLRKWILAVFILLLVLDSVPSVYWIYGNQSGRQPYSRFNQLAAETFIDKGKELTVQRLALMDLGDLTGEGAYIISSYDKPFMEVFGMNYETAVTADNIKRLNMAMGDEYYDYLFDRCINLGADTVIIQKKQVPYGEKSLIRLDNAAERNNYDFLYESGDYMLYHLAGVDGLFGTKTKYDAIGIGYGSYTLSLAYPNIKETSDIYLDHYTYEELRHYKTVYLSGFYYDDRKAAEDLVTRLSTGGVRVVILADGMPEDRDTRTRTFLGVTCNIIQFENGYPILYTEDFGEMDCDLFPRGYSKWITYYLNGLKDVKGTIYDNNIELAFFGSGINENVCYVGLNLPFYYYITKDIHAGQIMEWVMGMESGVLPDRQIVPLDVTYFTNGILINSPESNVNTALAYQDIFRSDNWMKDDNNLLEVGRDTTIIRFVYPYLWPGFGVTAFGFVMTAVFIAYCRRSYRRDQEAKAKAKAAEDEAETEDAAVSEAETEAEAESKAEEKEETAVDGEAEDVAESEHKVDASAENETETEVLTEIKAEIETESDIEEADTGSRVEENTESPVNAVPASGKKHGYDMGSFDLKRTEGDDFDLPFGETYKNSKK